MYNQEFEVAAKVRYPDGLVHQPATGRYVSPDLGRIIVIVRCSPCVQILFKLLGSAFVLLLLLIRGGPGEPAFGQGKDQGPPDLDKEILRQIKEAYKAPFEVHGCALGVTPELPGAI